MKGDGLHGEDTSGWAGWTSEDTEYCESRSYGYDDSSPLSTTKTIPKKEDQNQGDNPQTEVKEKGDLGVLREKVIQELVAEFEADIKAILMEQNFKSMKERIIDEVYKKFSNEIKKEVLEALRGEKQKIIQEVKAQVKSRIKEKLSDEILGEMGESR